MDATIELRFGLCAMLNIIGFAILGIFIPFLLAEGLQGEAIVQVVEQLQGAFYPHRFNAIYNERVRQNVVTDFGTCVVDEVWHWNQTDYCVDL